MIKCKLGDILDVKRGASLSGKYYSTKGKMVRLTLGNFNYPNGGFKENTAKEDIFFSGDVKTEFILKKDDIITPLTEQVAGLLGETARIPESNKYIQSGDIGLVIPNEKKLDKSFAYYLVSSPQIKKQLGAAAQQTKIRHTSPDKIKACETWIPDLRYQEKAGYILDIINSKIINNKKINVELEKIVKTLYNYWFLQYEFPNANGNPYKSTDGKMVWNEELKKEIPEGWKVTTIGEIIIERQKSSIKVGQAKNELGKYPFFTSGSEIYEMNEFLTDGRNCFLSTGGKGYVQYYVGKSSYSTDTWVISGINDLEDYLYLFIKSIENMLDNKYFAGTGLQHLQKDLFKDTHIVIPSDEILKRFNKISNTIFNKISKIYKENRELQNLRDFLLPLLMNGQVGFKS